MLATYSNRYRAGRVRGTRAQILRVRHAWQRRQGRNLRRRADESLKRATVHGPHTAGPRELFRLCLRWRLASRREAPHCGDGENGEHQNRRCKRVRERARNVPACAPPLRFQLHMRRLEALKSAAITHPVTVALLSITLVSNEWLKRPSYTGFRPVTSFTIN